MAEAGHDCSRGQSELWLLNLFGCLSLARSKTRLMGTFSSLGFDSVMWVHFKMNESIALGVNTC